MPSDRPIDGPPEVGEMSAAARSAVRRFVRRVGPQLRREFGQSNFYTANQVRQTVAHFRLPPLELKWAFALFCNPQEFEETRATTGCRGDYQEMRQQVAEYLFDGNRNFDPFDVSSAKGVGGPIRERVRNLLFGRAADIEEPHHRTIRDLFSKR